MLEVQVVAECNATYVGVTSRIVDVRAMFNVQFSNGISPLFFTQYERLSCVAWF